MIKKKDKKEFESYSLLNVQLVKTRKLFSIEIIFQTYLEILFANFNKLFKL